MTEFVVGEMVRAIARPELVLKIMALPSEADWRLGLAYVGIDTDPIYVDPDEWEAAVEAPKKSKKGEVTP